MFMQHRVLRKGLSARAMTGSVDRAFHALSIRTAGSGDGWRLGDTGSALVLCQTMPVGDDACYVMCVAVSEQRDGIGIIDTVKDRLSKTVSID